MKVCQRQPQSKRRFRALAWRFSSVLVESCEEEKWKLIIIGFGHKLPIKSVFGTEKPAEFFIQISWLQIGASTVINAMALSLLAQPNQSSSSAQLSITLHISTFSSVPAFFFRRLLSEKSIDQFSYQWNFFARRKTSMTCNWFENNAALMAARHDFKTSDNKTR